MSLLLFFLLTSSLVTKSAQLIVELNDVPVYSNMTLFCLTVLGLYTTELPTLPLQYCQEELTR